MTSIKILRMLTYLHHYGNVIIITITFLMCSLLYFTDPSNIDYESAVMSMKTLSELIPSFVQGEKLLIYFVYCIFKKSNTIAKILKKKHFIPY